MNFYIICPKSSNLGVLLWERKNGNEVPCPTCIPIAWASSYTWLFNHIRGKPKWEWPWIELRLAFLPVLQPGLGNTWFFWILCSDLWVHFFTLASAQWRWVLHSLIWSRLYLPPSSPQMRSSLISVSLSSYVRNPMQILNLVALGFKMLGRGIILVYGKTLIFGLLIFYLAFPCSLLLPRG